MVDDGSDPPVQGLGAEITSLRNPQSLGATAARNFGIRRASGQFIAMFDDDVELIDPTLLSRAAALAQRVLDCGAIGFRQLRASGDPYPLQPVASLLPCYTGVFFTYGSLARAKALRSVGLFESLFGFYYEEVELSLRLLDAGYSIIYDPSLSVIHYQDERGRDQTRAHRLVLRNTILTGLLRCPLWCVPGIILTAIARHVRWTGHSGKVDFSGIQWSIGEVLRTLSYIRTNRKSIRFATLQRKRRLTRQPQPIPDYTR